MTRRLAPLLLGVTAVLGVAAVAAGAPPRAAGDRDCHGIELEAGPRAPRLGRVAGSEPRVHFIANPDAKTKQCPAIDAACRRTAFVVPSDDVLVDRIQGDFACVSYKSPKGTLTDGWLPVTALELGDPSPPAPASADWSGKWVRDRESSVVLTPHRAEIAVEGEATYGALDPARVKSGAVNVGEVSGKARPHGNVLALGEGYDGVQAPGDAQPAADCLVRLRLFGRYLVAEDNGACGGLNVSFTGIYIRAKK